MKKIEHNVETGEVFEIDLTSEEIKAKEMRAAETIAYLEAEAEKAIKKAALLAKLGITAEEARLLFGGN